MNVQKVQLTATVYLNETSTEEHTVPYNRLQVKLAHSMDEKVGWLNGSLALVSVHSKKPCTKN